MDKSEILKHLEDDSKYYGEFGKQYLSNSDIGKLLKNPTQFRVNQEMTKPMLEGRYFHTKILEPQKIDNFIEVDVTSRNSVKYKEALENSLGETSQMTSAISIYQEIETNQVEIELYLYLLILEIFL